MAVTSRTLRLQDQIDKVMRRITDAQQRALQAAWGLAWDELRGDLEQALTEALAAGGNVTMTQLRRNRRLTLVLQRVISRLTTLVGASERRVLTDLRRLVDQAIAAQQAIVASQLPDGVDLADVARWSRVDLRQADAMVLRAVDRIHSGYKALAARAEKVLKRELIRGITVGANPRTTARWIVARAGEAGFGGGLARAMVIARTETLDAYREAGRIAQEPHADVLAGWTWKASLSPRTCRACLAMHGRDFPLSQPGPEGHQQCRCTRLPRLMSWADLGLDEIEEPPSLLPDATTYFEALTPEEQQAVLGRRGYQAWLAGEFPPERWATLRKTKGWRDSWVAAPPPAVAA